MSDLVMGHEAFHPDINPAPMSAIAKLIANSGAPLTPEHKVRVMIAVATSDWKMEVHTADSIRMMCNGSRFEAYPRFMFNDGVARSRNNLAALFLEDKKATHLFFYDSDIVMEPRQFDRLIEAKKPIIGAFYPKKQPVLDWVCNFLPDEVPDERGVLKVKHAGTGALLIERGEVEGFMTRHPELIYRGDPSPDTVRCDFFPMRAVDGAYKSEDWAFCEAIVADGGSIHIDTTVQLRHVGKIVYPLQVTLADDELVDIVYHRYGLWPDQVKSFFASGGKEPGLMGGHRERMMRLWPNDWPAHDPLPDLYDGGILQGSLEVPIDPKREAAPVILDVGADYGAVVRFISKRWPEAEVHCFEAAPDVFPFLQETIKGLPNIKADATLLGIDGGNALQLPKGNILILRVKGQERNILTALMSRFDEFDAIALVYEDATEAFFISVLMEKTHLLHCWQRLPDGRGIQKFINRRIEFGVKLLRADEPTAKV